MSVKFLHAYHTLNSQVAPMFQVPPPFSDRFPRCKGPVAEQCFRLKPRAVGCGTDALLTRTAPLSETDWCRSSSSEDSSHRSGAKTIQNRPKPNCQKKKTHAKRRAAPLLEQFRGANARASGVKQSLMHCVNEMAKHLKVKEPAKRSCKSNK